MVTRNYCGSRSRRLEHTLSDHLWLEKNDPNIVNELYKKARVKGRNSKEFIQFATSIFDYWSKFYDTAVELDTRDKELQREITRLREQLKFPDKEQLFKFYKVSNVADLVISQVEHIERLQAKLPGTKFKNIKPPRKG